MNELSKLFASKLDISNIEYRGERAMLFQSRINIKRLNILEDR